MTDEPKMPEALKLLIDSWNAHNSAPDPKRVALAIFATEIELRRLHERVAELERVLDVARDALVFAQKSHACLEIFDAIADIDAARNKEQTK